MNYEFYSFDSDPDPMTLVLKLDADIIEIHVHILRHTDTQIKAHRYTDKYN